MCLLVWWQFPRALGVEGARRPVPTTPGGSRPRRVSGLTPSSSPTRLKHPLDRSGSARASSVNRIARFPSSSGYFLGAGMILILPWIQTLHHTQDDPRALQHWSTPPICSSDMTIQDPDDLSNVTM